MLRSYPTPSRLRASHLLWPVWLTPGWIALWLAVSVPVDGQTLIDQRTTDAQITDSVLTGALRGLGVFGRALGIHGQDSLVVAGDLILDRADVVGEGMLLLKSNKPQQVISRNSTLENLGVDNPTQVALQGNLRVKQHLTVKSGTFNTTDGTLRLDPACRTQLLAGGQVKTGPMVRPALPVTRWTVPVPSTGLAGLMPVLPAPASQSILRSCPGVQPALRYTSLAHKTLVPPPEVATL